MFQGRLLVKGQEGYLSEFGGYRSGDLTVCTCVFIHVPANHQYQTKAEKQPFRLVISLHTYPPMV